MPIHPRFLILLTLAASLLLQGCDADRGEGEGGDRSIEPPSGCDLHSLSNVRFDFTIHYDGLDYPQDDLMDLMAELDMTVFAFPFPGVVTDLVVDEFNGSYEVTVTEIAPEGEEPAEDPNWLRVLAQLPLGYSLPVALDQEIVAEVVLDISSGELVRAFRFIESDEQGGGLLFLAEPSDVGMAYLPGALHPVFDEIVTRDRACPNISSFQCASVYNLSLSFTPHPIEEGGAPGEPFELYPTEHHDFVIGGLDLRVVNVWSYAHREINPDCTGFNWGAERFSYFVTRTGSAPPP